MPQKKCMRYLVSGKVQGVWFRASTQDMAKDLGLTGWAKNLPDSKVEVLACGDEAQLLKLYEWLKVGPELASVTGVVSEEAPWQDFERFAVK